MNKSKEHKLLAKKKRRADEKAKHGSFMKDMDKKWRKQ